jgi:hypothetical protein
MKQIYALLSPAGAHVPAASLRGPWAERVADSWIGEVRVGVHDTVRTLLDRQPRFSISEAEPGAALLVSPTTAGGRALLAGPGGAGIADAIGGYAGWAREQAGGTHVIHEVALSTSNRGFAANTMRNILAGPQGARYHPPLAPTPAATRALQRAVVEDGAYGVLRLGGANHEMGRIAVGPGLSRKLIKAGQDTASDGARRELSYALRHEGQHAVTPFLEGEQLQWLEEAQADLFTRAPGSAARLAQLVPAFARSTGADGWTTQPLRGYPRQVAALRGMLDLAGIDTSTAAGIESARTLLQGGAIEDAPAKLAAAVRAAHPAVHMDPETLATRLVAIDGSAAKLRALQRDLGIRSNVGTRADRDVLLASWRTPLLGTATLGSALGAATMGTGTYHRSRGGDLVPHKDAIVGAAALGAAAWMHHGGMDVRAVLPLALLGTGAVGGQVAGSVGSLSS